MQSQNSTFKTLPVFAIRATHYGVLIFIVFGWAFGQKEVLALHMAVIPLVILQWKLNQGRCLLTDLEHYLIPSIEEESEVEEEGFVARILKTIFKIELSTTQLMNFIYAVMTVSFLISLVKICLL